MMNKKVLFVELKDITTIPSGKEHQEDYLDYRVKYDFVKKLCENEELIRVNILEYDKEAYLWGLPEEQEQLVNLVGFTLASGAQKATVGFVSQKDVEDAFAHAAQKTKEVGILHNRKDWLIIGNEAIAKKFDVDSISLETFIDGADRTSADDARGETEE